MVSTEAKLSLDLQNVPLIEEEEEEKNSDKTPKKKSIYSVVIMKIFFIKSKKRVSRDSLKLPTLPQSPKLFQSSKSPKSPKSPKTPKSPKSPKLPQSSSEDKIKNGESSLEFVYIVTDFDQEQLTKAKGYIKSSQYSEALTILLTLSILEQVTKKQPVKSDYDTLFLIGNCYEYLKNFQKANKYYKLCADYLYDDGYWETNYGRFLLEHSLKIDNNNNNNNDSDDSDNSDDDLISERVENGLKRLLSAANKKRYVTAMYILGKVYIDGLYNVKQDFRNGELYLKRAYNGGEKDRAWAFYEKKAKELVANGQLSQVPLRNVWARS